MPNPTFAKEDSAAGTLDLETPLHTHFTHYGCIDFQINYNLTPLNSNFTLTTLLHSVLQAWQCRYRHRLIVVCCAPTATPLALHTAKQQLSASQEITPALPSKCATK